MNTFTYFSHTKSTYNTSKWFAPQRLAKPWTKMQWGKEH